MHFEKLLDDAQRALGIAGLPPDLSEAVERAEMVRLERQRAPQIADRRRHIIAGEVDVGAPIEALGIVRRELHDVVEKLERLVVILGAERLRGALHQQIDGIAARMRPETLDGRLDLLRGLGRVGRGEMSIKIAEQLRLLVRRARHTVRQAAGRRRIGVIGRRRRGLRGLLWCVWGRGLLGAGITRPSAQCDRKCGSKNRESARHAKPALCFTVH